MTAQTAAAINILISQAVALHLRVAMPVNVVEADKQTAQTERNQPNRVKRRDLHIVAYQRQRTASRQPRQSAQ